jgi:DNA-binding transcriptional LysR family regulator
MEMHYPAAICSLVQQGMGIGLLSKISADENAMEGQRVVSISELAGARQIGIIVHKRRRLSPQSKALIEMILRTSRKK